MKPSIYPPTYLSTYLPVYRPIYLSLFLSAYPSIYTFTYLCFSVCSFSICLPVCPSIHRCLSRQDVAPSSYLFIVSISPSIHPSTYLWLSTSFICLASVYGSICLSIQLPVVVSMRSSIYLSIHLSIYLTICLSIVLSSVPLSVALFIDFCFILGALRPLRFLGILHNILPSGSKYQILFKVSDPNTIKGMVLGNRNLKCWVLGPSAYVRLHMV